MIRTSLLTASAFAGLGFLVFVLAFLTPESVPSALPPVLGTPIITAVSNVVSEPQEDEEGWDCHTMGNRVCGPDHTG